MASSTASSMSGGSTTLHATTKTAVWVGRLHRDRPKEEVAKALAAIVHANPTLERIMESHFRCFCANAPQADVEAAWNAALSADNEGSGDGCLDTLQQMYWDDNPDENKLDTKSYELVKHHIEYERGYWKCGTPVGYARVDSATGDISILCQSKMRDVLQDVMYAQISSTEATGRRVDMVSIGPRWMADDTKRRYERIVVDPTMKSAKSNEFNLWSGFLAEKMPPVHPDLVDELIKPILEHIRDVLASGNLDHASYIVDWMAFLVQKPEFRTQTLLLFCGHQGAGKGIIWDFLREHVLGPRVSIQTANPKNDLFERFSNGFLYNRFVQLDEAQDLRQYEVSPCLAIFFFLYFECGAPHRHIAVV